MFLLAKYNFCNKQNLTQATRNHCSLVLVLFRAQSCYLIVIRIQWCYSYNLRTTNDFRDAILPQHKGEQSQKIEMLLVGFIFWIILEVNGEGNRTHVRTPRIISSKSLFNLVVSSYITWPTLTKIPQHGIHAGSLGVLFRYECVWVFSFCYAIKHDLLRELFKNWVVANV